MSCDVRVLDYNYVQEDQTDIYVSSVASDFPASNIKKYIRSKVFRTSSVTGDQYVVFDLKTIEEIDSVVILPHPIEGFKFSNGVTLKIQANATNEWSSPAVDQEVFIDEENQIASHFFTAEQSYRYWRVLMTDPFNAYGYFELGKVILGKKLGFNRIPSIGFRLNTEDQSKIQSTPYGHKYFDIYPNLKTLEVDLNLMDESDLYLWLDSFERVGRVSPVLISLDSTEEIFNKDRFVIYGTYENDMKHTHIVKNYFNMPLVIGEIL